MNCKCTACTAACKNKPGWFLPEEAEKVADFLGTTTQQLFDTKLGVDWWVGDEDTYVLAPATIKMLPGSEYPGDPTGQCVFFKDGLCEIHEVKPYECKQLNCNEPDQTKVSEILKHKVRDAWQNKQSQITDLLGHDPESTVMGLSDMLKACASELMK